MRWSLIFGRPDGKVGVMNPDGVSLLPVTWHPASADNFDTWPKGSEYP